MVLRNVCRSVGLLLWGAFLLVTSVYCLLAFLPYTYVALIKALPYAWLIAFTNHFTALYWTSSAIGAAVFYFGRDRRAQLPFIGAQLILGFFLPRFMASPSCDSRAYGWSLAPLALVVATTAAGRLRGKPDFRGAQDPPLTLFNYSTGIAAAVLVALAAAAGEVYSLGQNGSLHWGMSSAELISWSLLSHALVAIIVLSVLNLISLTAIRTTRPQIFRRVLAGFLVFGGVWFALFGFLQSALSFAGWRSQLYAASLAAALTLLGFDIVGPYLERSRFAASVTTPLRKLAVCLLALVLEAAAVILPSVIGGSDWSGFLHSLFALGFWLGLTVCGYALLPSRARYTWTTVLGVMILSLFAFKSLQATEIFWSRALGSTDGDIASALEAYAAQDASFGLAHHLLSSQHQEDCGDLCRILREYTNIRDAEVKADVNLVDPLTSTAADHPNIFIFVIDSLRPDYLGAYNPKVDFSPNLDAFARDSLVLHNVYTQYAGTSLSEPAIWSGMMLLHAHYMQPFSRVNSLEKLASVDGYQMIVSNDEVLSQLLFPSDGAIRLDTDKPIWNQLEVCSTIQQAEHVLDARPQSPQPVFFYTQPKNVHQFAHNNLPRMNANNWQARQGFVNRIAYEVHQVDGCMGGFFSYLKRRGIYDNSIIIVTSDHGDATGEFGRSSHSLSIYPEVMRVPLIVHLPQAMRTAVVYDDQRISALTDIAPTLYYLLGHKPILANPMFGRPLLADTLTELHSYHRDELFLASDERAVYGILADDGRFLYATYDSPAQSYLYDLANDPNAVRNILTPSLKKEYDARIIRHLQAIADFYGYSPKLGTLLLAGN